MSIEHVTGKSCKRLASRFLLSVCALFYATNEVGSEVVPLSNSLFFGGSTVNVDLTDCSPANSMEGKNRAIAAINASTTSRCIIEFGVIHPVTGIYITTYDEGAIGKDKVFLSVGGSAFRGTYAASDGQIVTLTNNEGKYRVHFSNITLIEPLKKFTISKKVTGDFGCN